MSTFMFAMTLGTSLLAASSLAAGGSSSLPGVLLSDGPSADRAEKMQLYGQFVGRWEFDTIIHDEAGGKKSGPRGEIHFGWVLEGRAIQDVWILPGVFYGSTLRVYDPNIDAWRIFWNDPLRQYYGRQIGRAQTGSIVQEGKSENGESIRWSFTEITPSSFRWIGELSPDNGKSWRTQIEFFAQRVMP
jgi:hypothetical protein